MEEEAAAFPRAVTGAAPGYCSEAAAVAVFRPAAVERQGAAARLGVPCSRVPPGTQFGLSRTRGLGSRRRTCTARRPRRSDPGLCRRLTVRWQRRTSHRRRGQSRRQRLRRAPDCRLRHRWRHQLRRPAMCRRRRCWRCSGLRRRSRLRIAAAPIDDRRRRHPGTARRSSPCPATPSRWDQPERWRTQSAAVQKPRRARQRRASIPALVEP
jgi:hypothetical protein